MIYVNKALKSKIKSLPELPGIYKMIDKEGKNLFLKKLFINIPTQNGNKFFLISRGQILLKESFIKYNQDDIELFIKNGLNLKHIEENEFEKSSLDFRNIIYSEVRSLPEEMITVIG